MTVEWKPLIDRFGAEVTNVSVDAPFDEALGAELRQLMRTRSVLLFRGRPVAAEDQIPLMGLFGPVADEFEDGTRQSFVSNVDGYLEDGRLPFHSDFTYAASAYLFLSLCAVELRGAAAPTHFASLSHGYAALPDALQRRIAAMESIHLAPWNVEGGLAKLRLDEEISDPSVHDYATIGEYPRRRWPVVLPHHDTGAPMLFVSETNSHICGLSYDDSEALLKEIFAYVYAPENVYVHEWRQDDLLIWDNFAVQHARPAFAATGAVRTLRRVACTEEGRSIPDIYEMSGAPLPRPMRALYPDCVR
jgi:alpha-ketoglutarate-dependent taurine dioxygenase